MKEIKREHYLNMLIKRINNGKTAKEITEELIEEAKKQINNTEYETNS